MSADMQCPKHDKLPLMLVSYCILISFSLGERSEGILNFSEPAKSTILRDEVTNSPLSSILSWLIWKIECDLELFAWAWVDPVALFYIK